MLSFIVWNADPEIIDLGFLSLRWYSLFFAAGFIVSYLILARYFRKENVVPSKLDNLTNTLQRVLSLVPG